MRFSPQKKKRKNEKKKKKENGFIQPIIVYGLRYERVIDSSILLEFFSFFSKCLSCNREKTAEMS